MRHGVLGLFSLGHLDFVILSSFVIGHSSLISINRLRPSMQPPWGQVQPGGESKFRIASADQSFAEHPQAGADFPRFQCRAVDFNRRRFSEIDQALVQKNGGVRDVCAAPHDQTTAFAGRVDLQFLGGSITAQPEEIANYAIGHQPAKLGGNGITDGWVHIDDQKSHGLALRLRCVAQSLKDLRSIRVRFGGDAFQR